MSTHLPLLVLLAMSVLPMQDVTPRAVLLAARDLAYDANYRNDQEGLRSAIDRLQPLASSSSDSAYAHDYLSWAFGALSASQLLASDSAATTSATRALEHARRGLEARATDPEFHVVLANSLIGVMFTDKSQFAAALSELRQVQAESVGAGPEKSSRRADRRRHYLQRSVRTERSRAWDRAPERGAAILRRRNGIQVDRSAGAALGPRVCLGHARDALSAAHPCSNRTGARGCRDRTSPASRFLVCPPAGAAAAETKQDAVAVARNPLRDVLPGGHCCEKQDLTPGVPAAVAGAPHESSRGLRAIAFSWLILRAVARDMGDDLADARGSR